jgi:hypothetical protein
VPYMTHAGKNSQSQVRMRANDRAKQKVAPSMFLPLLVVRREFASFRPVQELLLLVLGQQSVIEK